MKYILIIGRGSEAYWGHFPDVPGCYTAGATVEEIVANAAEALALHLEDAEAPAARTLAEILADPEAVADLDGTELFAPVAYDADRVAAV